MRLYNSIRDGLHEINMNINILSSNNMTKMIFECLFHDQKALLFSLRGAKHNATQ